MQKKWKTPAKVFNKTKSYKRNFLIVIAMVVIIFAIILISYTDLKNLSIIRIGGLTENARNLNGELRSLLGLTNEFVAMGTPVSISDCLDLQKIGRDAQHPMNGDYTLTNDINCSMTNPADPGNPGSNWDNGGLGFDPIGSFANPFTGSFDGNNKKIYNLYINRPSQSYISIFGYGKSNIVHNLALENVNITGQRYVGGLFGYAENISLSDIYVSGNISATESTNDAYTGALVGYACMVSCGYALYGAISNSYAIVDIKTNTQRVGGLVGWGEYLAISTSYSDGSVKSTSYVGGIAGQLVISNLYDSFSSAYVEGVGGAVVSKADNTNFYNCYYFDRGKPCRYEGTGSIQCYARTPISYFYYLTNPPMDVWNSANWKEASAYSRPPALIWQDFPPNEVAYYQFEGNANDASGYNNHGTIFGNPQTVSGKVNQAFSFNGTTDYVRIPRTIQDDFTISFWLNKKISVTNNGACSNDLWYCGIGLADSEVSGITNDFGLGIKDNKIIFGIGNPDMSILSNGVLDNDKWYLITATREKATGNIKIYINGVLNNSGVSGNVNSLNANSYIFLAEEGPNNRGFFNGSLDDVKIWNRVLSDSEIINEYQAVSSVTNCVNLDSPNTVYTQTANIIDNSLSTDCIRIIAQNITLDCNGYYISSTQNYSGIYSNQYNTTIKNCNISMGGLSGSNTNAIGIEFSGANNGTIFNNSANVSVGYGIFLQSSSNNNLTSNIGTSNSSYGIYLLSSSNNNLTSNIGTSNSSYGIYLAASSNNRLTSNTGASDSEDGIFLQSSSNNNLTFNRGTSNSGRGILIQSSSNNNLTSNIGISNSGFGIYVYSASNNNILNNNTGASISSRGVSIINSNNNFIVNQNSTGYSTGSYGFYLYSANNTIIKDCNYVSGISNDIYLTSNSINNTFVNCSYNILKEQVDAGSQLFRKWYYRAYVNDSDGNLVNNALVRGYNSSKDLSFSLSTNPTGYSDIFWITDYVNNGTRMYYSNYTINATDGTLLDEHSYNATIEQNNLKDVFTLSIPANPNEISGCSNLNQANNVYTQIANIIDNTITNDCIIISAQNITFDCNGYYISSTQNYSGIYSNQYNTTIKNCNITMGGLSGININAIGVEFASGANNGTIFNNTISIPVGYGIYVVSDNINITKNKAISNSQFAIRLNPSSNSILTNNIGISNSSYGILLDTNSKNNNLTGNTGASNSSYGILIFTSSNNTLKNNTGTSNSGYGIYLYSSANNTLINNTGSSNSNVGIYLNSASNNTLTNNTGISNSSVGIYLFSSSNNNILNNNTGTSNSSYGIDIHDSSNNNLTDNIGITKGNSYGLLILNGSNNRITKQRAEGDFAGSVALGIQQGSNNTIIRDCSVISAISYDVYMIINSKNNTIINCSYNILKEQVDAGSELFRKWYYRAYVNDTDGNPVNNALVRGYNSSKDLSFSLSTNPTGYSDIFWITDYVNNGTRMYYSNYTINATDGTLIDEHSYNVTIQQNNLKDVFTLSIPANPNEISGCSNLNQANNVYTQIANIIDNTITNDCIIISAQNITFDCNGYYISSTQNYSGIYSNQYNTTIKNCNISMGGISGSNTNAIGIKFSGADNGNIVNNSANASVGYGIYMYGGRNHTLSNNIGASVSNPGIYIASNNLTLINNKGLSNSGYGIYFYYASNNRLINSTGISDSSYGILIFTSSNNTLKNNTGTSNSGYGIYLASSSNNNLTSNTGTSNSGYGIYINAGSNNTLTDNIGTSNSGIAFYIVNSNNNTIIKQNVTSYLAGSYGFILSNADNNIIQDCIYVYGVANDIFLTSNSINNTFINCSYNILKEQVDAGSQLFRKWWYRAYVNDSNGNAVNNANVNAYNVTGSLEFSKLTLSDGYTSITQITDYVNNGGARSYYSNYTINATNVTFTDEHKYNATINQNNLKDVFTLEALTDTNYPQFTNYLTYPATNTQYTPNRNYQFNSTITSTNGTAGIEFNGKNYSSSNLSSVFNVSVSNLGAGTYNYYWWAYGNGTDKLFNRSSLQSYVIQQNNSFVLTLSSNPSWIVNYGDLYFITGSGCPSLLACNLYKNNTIGVIANPDVSSNNAAGYVNYTYNTTGNTNYSFKSVSQILIVNKKNTNCQVFFNSTTPQTYPYKFKVFTNCDSVFTLYRNGTVISNNSEQDLSAGMYNFTVKRTDTQNYSNIGEEQDFTINKASPFGNMQITGATPIIYPTLSNFVGSETNSGDGGCVYSMNRLNEIYGAGTWLFNYSTDGCTNYSSGSVTRNLVVNQNSTYSLLITGTSPITYGTQANIQGINCPPELSCNLYRNNTLGAISNPDNSILGVRIYNYTYNTTGNNNYSSKSTSFSLTVNKKNTNCQVFFNATTPQTYPYKFRVFTNCDSAFTLYRNGTVISNNSEQDLGAGMYNFTVKRTDTQNYSNIGEEQDFTINKASPIGNMQITGTTPIIYPTLSNFVGSDTNTGDSDCVYSMNRLNEIYGAGTWLFNYSTDGCGNYSSGSVTRNLVVNQNTTYSLLITGTTPITYGTQANIQGINCPSELSCNLYRNDTGIVTNPDNAILGAGIYNYVYNTSGNANYSSKSTSFSLTVNKKNTNCQVFFNATTPQTYPYKFKVFTNCDSAFALYRNGTVISNNSEQDLSAGMYNFTVKRTDIQNYSNIGEEQDFTINKGVPILLKYINGQTTDVIITYPQQVNATGIASGGTIKIFRNGVDVTSQNGLNVSLGAGTYSYEFNITGNQNYSSVSSQFLDVDILKASSPLTITILPSNPIGVGTQTKVYGNFSGGICPSVLTCNLYRNDTGLVANPDIQTLLAGQYKYTFNTSGNANYSSNTTSEILIITPDTEYPQFSNRNESPASGTEYAPNKNYQFNITITSTNGTAGIEFDGVNYLASNLSNVFSVTLSNLWAGTYQYYWWAYGNGTDRLYTKTPNYFYTVAKNITTTTLTTIPASPITYGTASNFSCSNSYGFSTILYIDSIDKSNEKGLSIVRGAKTYSVSCNYAGDNNYTASSQQLDFTINKASPFGNMQITGATPIIYPSVSNFIGSDTNTGDSDCVYSMNRLNEIYGAGTWLFNYSTDGCTNYSSGSVTRNLVVQQNSTYILSITGTTPITYGTQANIQGINCPPELSCNLYRNNTLGAISNPDNSILGVRIYNYTYNTTGNNNYSIKSTSFSLNVNKKNTNCQVFFNATTPQTYPYKFRVFTNCDSAYTLLRNGTSILNDSEQELGAGIYNFTVKRTDTQNYSNIGEEQDFTINKAVPFLIFLANDGTNNLTLTYPQQVNITAVASAGTVGLDSDGINVLSENALNVTLGARSYIYRANITGNQNYADVNYYYYNITITKADSLVYTYLNNTRGNIIILNNSEIWINGTREIGEGLINLYINETLINSGIDLNNNTLFDKLGLYNITTIYEETQNYTRSYETWWLNVSETIPPLDVNIVSPLAQAYSANPILFSVTLNLEGYCNYSLDNGNSNLTMNTSDNLIFSDSRTLANGNYVANFYCFDFSGNKNYTQNISFSVNVPAPVDGGDGGGGGGGGGGTPIINKPPVFVPIENITVAEKELVEFLVTATDPNKDNLSYSAFNLPLGAFFHNTTRKFSWTPGENQTGEYEIRFTVSDRKYTVFQNVKITVKKSEGIVEPIIEPIVVVTQEVNKKYGILGVIMFWGIIVTLVVMMIVGIILFTSFIKQKINQKENIQ